MMIDESDRHDIISSCLLPPSRRNAIVAVLTSAAVLAVVAVVFSECIDTANVARNNDALLVVATNITSTETLSRSEHERVYAEISRRTQGGHNNISISSRIVAAQPFLQADILMLPPRVQQIILLVVDP